MPDQKTPGTRPETENPDTFHDRAEPARRPGQPGSADETDRTVVDPNPGRRRDQGGTGPGLDADPADIPSAPQEPKR